MHGTYRKNIEGISKTGFRLPTSYERDDEREGELTFGKAIYLSSYSSKVTNYGDGVIIICNVIILFLLK